MVTSSVAAIRGIDPLNMPDGNILTEENWTDVSTEIGKSPYAKSKTLAERAAWDFLKALPEDE